MERAIDATFASDINVFVTPIRDQAIDATFATHINVFVTPIRDQVIDVTFATHPDRLRQTVLGGGRST